jgi:hypothetical protein
MYRDRLKWIFFTLRNVMCNPGTANSNGVAATCGSTVKTPNQVTLMLSV